MVAREHGDFPTAFREMQKEADAGAADGGNRWPDAAQRQGTPKDAAAAAQWSGKAVREWIGRRDGFVRVPPPCMGSACRPDPALGIQWITRAATAGSAAAMLTLGDCYQQGNGVPRNVVAAHDWLLKAAQAGSPDGMYQLADLSLPTPAPMTTSLV